METGKEIFKKANLGQIKNRTIIQYGKVGEDIGYELSKNNNTNTYILSFVQKINDNYIYDYNKCIESNNLQDILKYIAECKEKKKIINFKKTIDK